MSAPARVRRVRRVRPAVAVRPEREWEILTYPGGRYVASREPIAELIGGAAPAVAVLHTHDYALAARTACPLWAKEQGGRLSRPVRRWWRQVPVDVREHGVEHVWRPTRPGLPGATPVVEFPAPAPAPPAAGIPYAGARSHQGRILLGTYADGTAEAAYLADDEVGRPGSGKSTFLEAVAAVSRRADGRCGS